ncbi:hypothetical protein B6K69_17875 (plasmid) [Fuscovulum blasticum]|nr:hypothetical protein B6K69_17875 [Fuscovulum blasticum]
MGSAASSTYNETQTYTGPQGTIGLDVLLEHTHSSPFFGSGLDDWVSFDGGATQLTVQQYLPLAGVTVSIDGGAPVAVPVVYTFFLSDGTVVLSLPASFITAQSLDGTEALVFNLSGATDNSSGDDIGAALPNLPVVPCFTRGTMILADGGDVAIEDLRQGDLIMTLDSGPQPILWIGRVLIGAADLARHPHLKPIRIKCGALGDGLPRADLVVSPQHRVLVRSAIVERMFGKAEVLVAAKHLTGLAGVDVAEDAEPVEYWHFLLGKHHIVLSNGAPTESLFTGPEAMKALPEPSRREIFEIFPHLAELDHAALIEPARMLVRGRRARRLAERMGSKAQRQAEPRQPVESEPESYQPCRCQT